MPVKMRAPNGEEREVSEEQVAHYKARGAVIVDNPVASTILGALPVVGGIGGGILGAGAGTVFGMGVGGIPGAMLGSGTGAAGGEALRQLIMRQQGMQAPATPGDAARNIGVVGLGAGVGGAIPGAGKALVGGAMRKAPEITRAVIQMMAQRIPGVRTAQNASTLVKLFRSQPAPVPVSAAKRIATTKAAKAAKPPPVVPLRAANATSRKPAAPWASHPNPVNRKRAIHNSIINAANRGASSPELQRRTAARAQAIGKAPAMGDDNLGALLLKSLELEAEMSRMGLDQATRMTMRNQLGRIVP